MCTVSFVNVHGKIIITSNRDEKVLRPQAVEPKTYHINQKKVIFPKDGQAGGTWYAIDEFATVLVLLNGADERHTVKPNYRKSRGLIVLDLIGSESPLAFWEDIELEDIEPFTIVLYENQKLYQLRWNAIEKSIVELDRERPHIWSSSTLYSEPIRTKRSQWFHAFLDIDQDGSNEAKPVVDETALFHFHRYTESENTEHGLVINRNEILKTVSITQTVLEHNKVMIRHADLLSDSEFSNVLLTV